MSFYDPLSRRQRLSRLPAFAQYEERMSAYATDGSDPTDPLGIPPVQEPPWDDSPPPETEWQPANPPPRVRVSGPFEALPEDESDRPSRGILAGAFVGLVAAGSALGISNLVAAFVRPQASPVIAVGNSFIDHTPSWLKNLAVQYFGENDKNALLIGMYVTIALLAMGIGMIAWRHVWLGVIALALFGGFGAYVAVTRPESRVTDVIPSVAAGITGATMIFLLVWAGKPRKSIYRTDGANWS